MLTGRITKRDVFPVRVPRRGPHSNSKYRAVSKQSKSRERRRRLKRKASSKQPCKMESAPLPITTLLQSTPQVIITPYHPFMHSSVQLEVLKQDPERPSFHVMPLSGWLNDPNGPIYYKGHYHLFYQHVPGRVEWDWGLVWGHAVSTDLIHWQHLPIAIQPSPDGPDADGCFSGCCVLNDDGIPTILYTGVRLRSHFDEKIRPLPPKECDLQLPFIETQLAAVADLDDDDCLKHFHKMKTPVLSMPPASLGFMGWRDPFIVKGSHHGNHLMLIGSGIKGTGGTVLKYKSSSILSGWTFDGYLCTGDADTGAMWECPLLVKLQESKEGFISGIQTIAEEKESISSTSSQSIVQDLTTSIAQLDFDKTDQKSCCYFFCVSPDAPTNPVIYWLGQFDAEKETFSKETAQGPFRLDLGDVVYAPNLTEGPNGDILLWTWIQEKRQVGAYDYSGCLSVPRKLTLRSGKLFQEPVVEIKQLRKDHKWQVEALPLFPEEPISVEGIQGQSVDMELKFTQGSSEAAGILIRSWKAGGEGTAAIIFDWERSCLDVSFEALDPDTMEFYLDCENSRRISGPIDWKLDTTLELRVLLDSSALEIFTASGEVLSTRVYRGDPLPGDDSGIDFVSFGGIAEVTSASIHEMESIWKTSDASLPSLIANDRHTTSSPHQQSDPNSLHLSP